MRIAFLEAGLEKIFDMKILFVHLLNNYTGSPKVLAVLINELCVLPKVNLDFFIKANKVV